MLASVANRTNMQYWPTIIKKLINVGQHFKVIYLCQHVVAL